MRNPNFVFDKKTKKNRKEKKKHDLQKLLAVINNWKL